MASLMLDPQTLDLCVDVKGNIAVANEPYATAQDMACAIKLFKGELYYDTTQGVPYWQEIYGYWPPPAVIKTQFAFAAGTVPGVKDIVVTIQSVTNRTLYAQVQGKTESGAPVSVTVGAVLGPQYQDDV